jgi:2-polyprenyl-3-methyl-5-hydroxy-6-metoxy-1,4-benzoquinol methylase
MERVDPENNESRALFDMVDFSGQNVLEIGCGDGRVTWFYADQAAHVTAIDPVASQIALAKDHLPGQLKDRLEFQHSAFEDFAASSPSSVYDIILLSQSLC